jgi:hypothetical protein
MKLAARPPKKMLRAALLSLLEQEKLRHLLDVHMETKHERQRQLTMRTHGMESELAGHSGNQQTLGRRKLEK